MVLGDRLRRAAGPLGLCMVIGCGSVDPEVKEARDVGHEACNRYIDCVLEVTPEAVAPVLMSYGPEGDCWDTEDLTVLDICRRACTQGIEGLGKLHPDVGACGQCQVDEHCAEVERRSHCEPASNRCVTCLEDDHCAEGFCHPELNACVLCVSDSDCASHACDPKTHSCVGCLTDEHCGTGFCNTDKQLCAECDWDPDCPEGRCDLESEQCVECLGEGDCTTLEDCVEHKCVAK